MPAKRNVKKILMTVDTVGGVWTYAMELVKAFESKGIMVHCATMGAPLDSSQREHVRSMKNLEIYESTHKLEWMDDPWEDIDKAGRWLLSLENEIRPDIVHLNGYCHASLPWSVPVVVVGHSCVVSWYHAVKRSDPPPAWHRYREKVAEGLHCADLVVAPTQWMMDRLTGIYGTFAKGHVIYNGLDAAGFAAGEKEPLIMTAGRLWDEAKNAAAVAAAAVKVHWKIVAAGSGAKAIPDSPMQQLGRLPASLMRNWFSRASVFALPARYEPFGLTPLEAALSGCALVLGDIESFREIWADTALYVDPDDPDMLASVLNQLASNKTMLDRYAFRARTRAQRFTTERMARHYCALYRTLIYTSRVSQLLFTGS